MTVIPDKSTTLSKVIERRILDGGYYPGMQLPTERELVAVHRVSRTTVRLALKQLAASGLVERRAGDGTYISKRAAEIVAKQQLPSYKYTVACVLRTARQSNPLTHEVFRAFVDHLHPDIRPSLYIHSSPKFERYFDDGADCVVLDGGFNARVVEHAADVFDSLVVLNYRTAKGNYIVTDNFRAGYMAAEYAIKQGHRRIGVLEVDSTSPSGEFHQRYLGACQAMQEHGIDLSATYQLDMRDNYHPYNAVTYLLNQDPKLSAIFCVSDRLAYDVCEALEDRGIKIPEQISIIGCDDHRYSRYLNPPLTTIKQPMEAIGLRLAEAVNVIVSGQPVRIRELMAPVFMERGSVRKMIESPAPSVPGVVSKNACADALVSP